MGAAVEIWLKNTGRNDSCHTRNQHLNARCQDIPSIFCEEHVVAASIVTTKFTVYDFRSVHCLGLARSRNFEEFHNDNPFCDREI